MYSLMCFPQHPGGDGGCSPILAVLAPPAHRRVILMARTTGGGRTVDQPSPQGRRTRHIGREPHPRPRRSVRTQQQPRPQVSPRAVTPRRSDLPGLHRCAYRCIRAPGRSDRHVAPAPRRTTRSESCRSNGQVRLRRVRHAPWSLARSLLRGQIPPRCGGSRGRTAACSSPAGGLLLAASGPRIRPGAAPDRVHHLPRSVALRASSRPGRAHAECVRSRSTTDPTVPDSPCRRLSLIPRTVCLNGSFRTRIASMLAVPGQGVPQPCPSASCSPQTIQTQRYR